MLTRRSTRQLGRSDTASSLRQRATSPGSLHPGRRERVALAQSFPPAGTRDRPVACSLRPAASAIGRRQGLPGTRAYPRSAAGETFVSCAQQTAARSPFSPGDKGLTRYRHSYVLLANKSHAGPPRDCLSGSPPTLLVVRHSYTLRMYYERCPLISNCLACNLTGLISEVR